MNKFESASILAGISPNEEPQVSEPTNLHVITGEVVANSENGSVLVSMDGLVFSEDDTQYIEMDTIGGLEEGDEATIILAGEAGSSMTPLAIGSTGSVDRLSARVIETELLIADKADIEDLEAATARIGDLEADHVSVSDFSAEQANIDNLQAATADIDTIRANSAKVQNLTAAQLEADHAKVGQLDVDQIAADHATIGTLDTTYMHADMANADVAWIQNGTIKNGAITSAMINDVSANKLTAGTINGSVINVTNLNADNITAGTINGQRIGEGSLSLDKLSEDVYTETEVNNIVDGLNDRIDGAIETHTGTAVPTLNNAPASSWNTTALRNEHVGDVYYVVNSQSQQNGYCYRFTKSGSTYSWQLIKDSDVTAALSRLTTAEGKITNFDSDISTLKTTTGTLTTKTESLETRMSDAEEDILDKVDTTTFNEISDTVEQHSLTISQHTTAISNKADGSTVTAVTNRVSKNEQDITGITTTLGELQETVETKADGSTVTTISNRLNTVSNTVDGHTQTLTNVQNTQTTMQTTLDKTAKSSIQLWYSKANTTAPSKPTSQVTSTSTSGNAWRTVVPAYNASYPHYYYCWQYEYVDGTYGWSAVVRDIAMGESQATARTADSTANANIKSSVQLWFTKANSTAPNKPTSVVSTSNANTANAWNLVVPVWNSSYPHYFYCYQQQKGDGTYQWTDVVYDRATSEAQQLANTTSTNLNTLQTDYATFKQTTEQFESTVGTTYATKTELKGATDDITELEGRVSTNETSISNNSDAIALKANSSDVYTKSGVDGLISTEVTNRNAAITAKANEITSTVSQTYTTKEEFDNLEIGGRNLLAKTKELTSGVWVYDGATRGDNVAQIATSDKRIYQLPSVGYWTWTNDTTYAVSVDARADASTVLEINAVGASSSGMKKQFTVGTLWERYAFVFTANTVNTGSLSFYRKGSASTTLYLRRPKLEVGNKPTDWTPAPEDIETRVSSAESAITQNADNIALKVSKDGVISSINQSAESVTINANKINLQGAVTISDLSSDAQSATLNSNISVGGRNWLLDTGTFNDWVSSTGITFSNGVATFPSRSSLWWACIKHLTIPAADFFGNTWTFSFDYRSDDFSDTSGNRYIDVNLEAGATYNASNRTKYRGLNSSSISGASNTWVPTTEWQRGSVTFTAADESFLSNGSGNVNYVGITIWSYTLNSFQVRRMKLEKGNTATDWSQAPEDAAKTATSYVTDITGGGIMVHPSTDDYTGVRITSDVDIRQDNVSIANFGALDSNNNPTARVGKADSKHVLIDPDYVYIIDGSASSNTQLAKFGEFIRLGSDTDPMLDIRDGWMYFYPTADDVQSLYFGPTTRIQRLLNGSLKLQSDNGAVSLYGQTIGVAPANGTNSYSTAAGTVLWSNNGWMMTAGHTANLTYNISTCPTGIVLHFQPYTSSTTQNYNHTYYFVPKTHVASYNGAGIVVRLGNPDFSNMASKYLYISNDHITGHAQNNTNGTNSGITYNNATWVMTQVIAV